MEGAEGSEDITLTLEICTQGKTVPYDIAEWFIVINQLPITSQRCPSHLSILHSSPKGLGHEPLARVFTKTEFGGSNGPLLLPV